MIILPSELSSVPRRTLEDCQEGEENRILLPYQHYSMYQVKVKIVSLHVRLGGGGGIGSVFNWRAEN